MVALAILAMSLTVLSGISANSFDASNYAKFLTVSTMLARSKMIDIEEELRKDGFGDDEKTFDGDFSEEGHPGIKWTAVCRPIEVELGELVSSLLGGDFEDEDLPDAVQNVFGGGSNAPLGEDITAAAGGAAAGAGGTDLNQLLAGGGLEPILKGVGETLQKSIREITLEIKWKAGDKYEESVRFVQYVTTSGRLALPENTPPRLADPSLPGQRNPNTLQGTIGGQVLPGLPGGTINFGSPGGGIAPKGGPRPGGGGSKP
jgi:general secretion pathway protein I